MLTIVDKKCKKTVKFVFCRQVWNRKNGILFFLKKKGEVPFFLLLFLRFKHGTNGLLRSFFYRANHFVLKVEIYSQIYQNNLKRLKAYKNNDIIRAINEFS